MKRWLGAHRYALRVAVRRLLAQPFSTLANLLVVALSLSVVILGMALVQAAQPLVRSVSTVPEITLFLPLNAATDAADRVADRIRREFERDVQSVRTVSAQQAYQRLRTHPDWQDALSVLADNPLPASVIVTLRTGVGPTGAEQSAQVINILVEQWRQWQEIEHVQHDSEWMQRLQGILDFVRTGVRLLMLGVALVVLATVFNTVRMQALAQREEISIARLVGATQAFVRRPFLYLGALTGLLAAVLAVMLGVLALLALNRTLAPLAHGYGAQLALSLPDAATLALTLLATSVLGAVAASWSVTRNTRF